MIQKTLCEKRTMVTVVRQMRQMNAKCFNYSAKMAENLMQQAGKLARG